MPDDHPRSLYESAHQAMGRRDFTAAVASLASTSYVNSAVSGLTTNLTFLDASTNAFTGYITNGLWKGVSSP